MLSKLFINIRCSMMMSAAISRVSLYRSFPTRHHTVLLLQESMESTMSSHQLATLLGEHRSSA